MMVTVRPHSMVQIDSRKKKTTLEHSFFALFELPIFRLKWVSVVLYLYVFESLFSVASRIRRFRVFASSF